ncbi:hypothetical protein CF5_0069 [Staphylococcus phage CF5]|uniref:Uncharacterized protein n=1 Tax=Staphylococcus phage CF5 TaxID=3113739 RepID=A0AAX4J7M9_9CAUD|nr:hypothetical protein CF5_0069 [Staphylococcus phage CF5]
MTKYKDILKLEFKDALSHFKRNRKKFHMYRINRLLINGSIIHFDYAYLPCNDPNIVMKELDLQEYGKLRFEINVKTSYGKIVTDNYLDIINNFLENYDVYSESELVNN